MEELVNEFRKIYAEFVKQGYWGTSAHLHGKPGTPMEKYDILVYVVSPMKKGYRADLDEETYLRIVNDYYSTVRRGIAVYIVEDGEKKAIVIIQGGYLLLNQIIGGWFEAVIEDIRKGTVKPQKIEKTTGTILEIPIRKGVADVERK